MSLSGVRRLRSETRGLSTVEYIIILLVVALVGVAAWRMFGGSTARRAESAGQDVGGLEGEERHGGGARARGGIVVSTQGRLDEATGAVAAPPAETRFDVPAWMLGLAAALVVFLVGQRVMKGDGGAKGGGAGGGGSAKG